MKSVTRNVISIRTSGKRECFGQEYGLSLLGIWAGCMRGKEKMILCVPNVD
jgi:hypothetical protein